MGDFLRTHTNIINEVIVSSVRNKYKHSSKKHRNTQYPYIGPTRYALICISRIRTKREGDQVMPFAEVLTHIRTELMLQASKHSDPLTSSIWLTPAAARSPSWRERLAPNLSPEHPAIPPATARQDEAY